MKRSESGRTPFNANEKRRKQLEQKYGRPIRKLPEKRLSTLSPTQHSAKSRSAPWRKKHAQLQSILRAAKEYGRGKCVGIGNGKMRLAERGKESATSEAFKNSLGRARTAAGAGSRRAFHSSPTKYAHDHRYGGNIEDGTRRGLSSPSIRNTNATSYGNPIATSPYQTSPHPNRNVARRGGHVSGMGGVGFVA